jgi:hypothetical protein
MSNVDLARWQFAFVTINHFFFVPVTIGLAFLTALLQTAWYRSKREENPSVGVVQTFGGPKGDFVDPPKGTGIYKNCSDAQEAPPPCLTVGSVGYTYGIGEFESAVSQYFTFLNTADPRGKNLHDLYNDDMGPAVWPKYGSIRYTPGAATGEHYSVAYPEWADKPFNFGDFRRGARFANSLTKAACAQVEPSVRPDERKTDVHGRR